MNFNTCFTPGCLVDSLGVYSVLGMSVDLKITRVYIVFGHGNTYSIYGDAPATVLREEFGRTNFREEIPIPYKVIQRTKR